MNIHQKLSLAKGILEDIKNSGYIPFASPAPSSTESQIKKNICEAVTHIENAIYLHESCFFGRKGETLDWPALVDCLREEILRHIKDLAKKRSYKFMDEDGQPLVKNVAVGPMDPDTGGYYYLRKVFYDEKEDEVLFTYEDNHGEVEAAHLNSGWLDMKDLAWVLEGMKELDKMAYNLQ